MDIEKNTLITATINGQEISAPLGHSIVQALWYSGNARVKSIGCLEGVCGSCRIMVRRSSSLEVVTELACQTNIEEGMQVIFPLFHEPLSDSNYHSYQLSDMQNMEDVPPYFLQTFPEASHCRNCSGCTKYCPKEIDVELGVNLAVEGKFREAGDLFITCIMCDICIAACPENISPNHVGLFSRRVTACFDTPASNLNRRIAQINSGELAVDTRSVVERSEK